MLDTGCCMLVTARARRGSRRQEEDALAVEGEMFDSS